MDRAHSDTRLDEARALDAEDELAGFRAAFYIPERDGRPLIYLCGHSLGLMPRTARERVEAELEAWARLGVEAHFDARSNWFAYHEQFAEPLAELIGAAPDEVVAMNSLTVNLHLMLVTFFRPAGKRNKILIERNAFPSDRYAVRSQLRFHGLEPGSGLVELGGLLDPAELERVLAELGEHVALILLPGVQFLTGQVLDIPAFAQIAHRYGCVIGFDVAHAVGNVPLKLSEAGADFAVWCSYKYLNAGPGAVGGCFVHRRWSAERGLPRFEGWWGHDKTARFALAPQFEPIPGVEAWQLSNPPILAMAPLGASLDLFRQAGLARLRAKSIRLTAFLDEALRNACGDRIEILTPTDASVRGCQISIRLKGTAPNDVAGRLRDLRVVADWRAPDILRLAPVPLYNSFRDAAAAARAVRTALDGS